ncbi:alpha/beta fold hydrolase [Flavobacteriaceae bacterium R38]|nr:alpha/beta fold hydrolase [Flavobacteriaceae bacterium R38]
MKKICMLFFSMFICTYGIKAQQDTIKTASVVKTFQAKIEQEGITEALEWYNNTKTKKKYDIKEMETLAYTLAEQGEFEECLAILKLNVREFPNSKAVFNERYVCNIAEYLWKSNLPEKALQFMDLNMKINPESEQAQRVYGEYYLHQGKEKLAVKYFKKAAQLNPRNNLFQIAFKVTDNDYKPTEIPNDTLKLFKSIGDFNNKTAFVYVQGGPDLELNIHDKDALHLLPNADKLLKIYPLQAAMLNPELVVSIPNLTTAQSDFENIQSAEILHRTISYLKSKNKTVYLIGHSYGASIIMEYLYKYDSPAEKIVLMGKDFDEDMRSYKGLKSGFYIRWHNGTEPVLRPFFGDLPETFTKENNLNAVVDNLTMLVKTHSAKRFTQLLNNKDLSNLIFVHARYDEANGRVSDKELQFLNSKGVKTIQTFGDHHSMLTKSFMGHLYDHLISGILIKKYTVEYILNVMNKNADHDINSIIKSLEKHKENYYPVEENNINNLGYRFLERNQLDKAIIVFGLNTHWFPNSANAYDSLGEAYLKKGDNMLAKENYKKSIAIHPNNPNAIRILEQLEGM